MRYQDHCAALRRELSAYRRLVWGADPATPVPTCPGWDLAGLTDHLGSTHRWVTEMLVSGSEQKLPYRSAAPADPAVLPDWFAEGAEKLLAAFEATEPSQPVWSWGADQHVRFWPRRMLHEAAVHHADAALALGSPPAVPAEVAADGVDEFLGNLPYAQFRPPDFAAVDGAGRSIGLLATDLGVGWRLDLRADGFSWRRTGRVGGADALVAAPVVQLYLFVWGRVRPRGVVGDGSLLERWRAATPL